MVFQYQYQYQYQLQRGLGLTTYESFSQMLQDTYSNPVILSLLVALVPLIYFFFRNRFVKTRFFQALLTVYGDRRRDNELRRARLEFEEAFLKKKKIDYASVFIAGFTVLVGALILTQSLFFVAVTSNSMAPVFWESDLVLVQAISNDPQEGDIAVFQNPLVQIDDKVIHRIHRIGDDDVITKGDNNNFPDDWVVDRGSVLGTAVTYNGRPIVAKKIGRYFIQDYGLDKGYSNEDPTYQILSWSLSNIHSYGPIYLVAIVLLLFITMLERPNRGKVY